MSKRLRTLWGLAALAGLLGFAGQALSADKGYQPDRCFLAGEWQGWKSPSPNVIYVRVGVSRVYEFDLSFGSDQLQEPAMHLVSVIRGSNWICGPLDLQLQLVDDHHAFAIPLFVKSISRLTPEQIAAIPRKYLP